MVMMIKGELAWGSTVHAWMVAAGMPADNSAAPKGSACRLAPVQLRRSARASKGDALACTPLSPTFCDKTKHK